MLRALTDEVMYAIMKLSGQEYVDEYAQRAKVSVPRPRRHRGAGDGTPGDTASQDGRAGGTGPEHGGTGDGGPRHAEPRTEIAAAAADESADE